MRPKRREDDRAATSNRAKREKKASHAKTVGPEQPQRKWP